MVQVRYLFSLGIFGLLNEAPWASARRRLFDEDSSRRLVAPGIYSIIIVEVVVAIITRRES